MHREIKPRGGLIFQNDYLLWWIKCVWTSKDSVWFWLCRVASPYSQAWKYGLNFSCLPVSLFRPIQTVCSEFQLRGRTLEMLRLASVKCTQCHIFKVMSQRCNAVSIFRLQPDIQKHAHVHTLHACTEALVLYLSLCWAHTPCCLTCFLCHDDEKHLLFSAESPLHPTLLTSSLHYSQVKW